MIIKKLTEFEKHDLDRIMEIWLTANISAHSFISKEFWENAYDLVRKALPVSDMYICRDDNTIKAFIGITDRVYIAGLFVDELYQSQGIGKKLLDYCKWIYPRLELDVFVENKKAVNFYLKNSFITEKTKMNTDFNREEYHMVWPAED